MKNRYVHFFHILLPSIILISSVTPAVAQDRTDQAVNILQRYADTSYQSLKKVIRCARGLETCTEEEIKQARAIAGILSAALTTLAIGGGLLAAKRKGWIGRSRTPEVQTPEVQTQETVQTRKEEEEIPTGVQAPVIPPSVIPPMQEPVTAPTPPFIPTRPVEKTIEQRRREAIERIQARPSKETVQEKNERLLKEAKARKEEEKLQKELQKEQEEAAKQEQILKAREEQQEPIPAKRGWRAYIPSIPDWMRSEQ